LDPRVQALALAMGMLNKDVDEMEVRLIDGDRDEGRRWIEAAPCNPTAALLVKGGVDEAINANVFIAAAESVRNKITPRYRPSKLWMAFNWLILIPVWVIFGIFAAEEVGAQVGAGLGISLIALHLFSIRFRSNAHKEIKFRDQRGMISYARRLRRGGARLKPDTVPVANHLLMNGLLVSVNGNVFDIGYPGWLFNRFPIEKDKLVKTRLFKAAKRMKKGQKPRYQRLGKGWWVKHERERGRDLPILEEIIGPPAYRGRNQHISSKKAGVSSIPKLGKMSGARQVQQRRALEQSEMTARGMAQGTRRSERRPAQRQTPASRRDNSDKGMDFR